MCNDQYLSVAAEAIVIGYNTAFHDEPPVSNWWALTDTEWQGKVYAPNPAKSVTTLSAMAMLQKYESLLEQAYFDHYGVPFSGQSGEGAAKTFIRKLLENGLHIVNSSDETAEAIGAPGTTEDNLGIIVSSKIRLTDIGYTFANIYDAAPFGGFINPVNIMVAGGSKNINAANLFILWIIHFNSLEFLVLHNSLDVD